MQEKERIAKDDPGTRKPRPKEPVVNSPDIKWKPVDRVAAIVTAPAKWIHKPNAFVQLETNTMSNKDINVAKRSDHPMEDVTRPITVPHDKPDEIFDMELAQETIRRKNRLMDDTIDLAIRTMEAREAISWNCNNLKKDWMEWMLEANKHLHELRMLRMAVDSEAKQLLSYSADVRKFFLSDLHVEEMARLREFVGVCERLEELKKRGTLDAISDVILKLAGN